MEPGYYDLNDLGRLCVQLGSSYAYSIRFVHQRESILVVLQTYHVHWRTSASLVNVRCLVKSNLKLTWAYSTTLSGDRQIAVWFSIFRFAWSNKSIRRSILQAESLKDLVARVKLNFKSIEVRAGLQCCKPFVVFCLRLRSAVFGMSKLCGVSVESIQRP